MCKKIKTDNKTCHIPVILLTALSDLTQRINGLEVGADAYITKPFSLQLLQLNIYNMLALREAVQKRHNQNLFLGPRNFIDNSQDEKFLNRLVGVIDQNLDNSELSLADLTLDLGMSKSVLYKKFSALTDLSLTDFIKNQRLKQAATLLKQDKFSISDIAMKVGFNDVKYFSKEFKKMYGVTPSHYIKNV
jgi:AraC-like DNA-binding protein